MQTSSMRLDKWLWCTRFFKTRSLAAQVIKNGRVSVNDQKAKPAKTIVIGDAISFKKDNLPYTILVEDLSANRLSATLAAKLYSESKQSIEERSKVIELIKANNSMIQFQKGKPEKKQRRDLERFKRGEN